MAREILWLGHAPDRIQIDHLIYDENAVISEGDDLIFTCNGKTITVEAGTALEDQDTSEQGDTSGVLTMLQLAESAINTNAQNIPEFKEVRASLQSYSNDLHVLSIEGRTAGVPHTITVTAPNPSVDIDVEVEGDVGVNAKFSWYIPSTVTGGSYVLNLYHVIGTGTGTATGTAYIDSATLLWNDDADDITTKLIAQIDNLDEYDFAITGTGTQADPFVLEYKGSYKEMDINKPTIVANLTGGGEVVVTNIRDGSEAGLTDTIGYTFIPVLENILVYYSWDGGETQYYSRGKQTSDVYADLETHLDATFGANNYDIYTFPTPASGSWLTDTTYTDYPNTVYYSTLEKQILVLPVAIRFKNSRGGSAQTIPDLYCYLTGPTNDQDNIDPTWYKMASGTPIQYGGGLDAQGSDIFFLTNDATSGTFTLNYDGTDTTPISWDAIHSKDGLGGSFNEVEGPLEIAASGKQVLVYQQTRVPIYYSQSNYDWIQWGAGVTPVRGGLVKITHTGTGSGAQVVDLTGDGAGLVGGTLTLTKLSDAATGSGQNEIKQIYTTGNGGTYTITDPTYGTTNAIDRLSGKNALDTRLEAIYGAGTIRINSGTGTAADPWEVEWIGTLAATNISNSVTGDGSLLTGITLTVTEEQTGVGPTGSEWSIYTNGTGGTISFEIFGRTTTATLTVGTATTTDIVNALKGLAPGDFSSDWVVNDDGLSLGTFADPWKIKAQGKLKGAHYTLQANNENITGSGASFTYETYQTATGKHWIDNDANYRVIETGQTNILPQDDDILHVQIGNEDNSMKYGSFNGIKFNKVIFSSRSSVQCGLPEWNPNGYYEYRNTFIDFSFNDSSQSPENPNILFKQESGSGSGLVRMRTGDDEVHIRVETTGGPSESNRPSFCWDSEAVGTGTANNALNTLQVIDGFVGIAVFAATDALLEDLVIRGGTVNVGDGLTISGRLDQTDGDLSGRCTVGNVPVIFSE